MIIIKKMATGYFGENCYIIGDNSVCCVIDPGAPAADILKFVEDEGLRVKFIILTHMHYDHIISTDIVRKATGATVACHRLDAPLASDPVGNCSGLFGSNLKIEEPDILFEDGDIVTSGEIMLEIIHTPGHTRGSICIKNDKNLFTGDTLFCMSIGRTDLGGGDQTLLLDSIRNKLLVLPDDTIVYPGHGMNTDILNEKMKNSYLWENGI